LLFRNQRLHALTRISHHSSQTAPHQTPARSAVACTSTILYPPSCNKIISTSGARVFFHSKIRARISPSTIPTLTAATKSAAERRQSSRLPTNFSSASPNATNAPVMEAVRVPPCRLNYIAINPEYPFAQPRQISHCTRATVQSASRISWCAPLGRPFATSRDVRSQSRPRIMAYSLEIHPLPVFRMNCTAPFLQWTPYKSPAYCHFDQY